MSRAVEIIYTVTAHFEDSGALRRAPLNNRDIGPILNELESGEHSESQEVACTSLLPLTEMSHTKEWLTEVHWIREDHRSITVHRELPCRKAKDVLAEFIAGISAEHLHLRSPCKTSDKFAADFRENVLPRTDVTTAISAQSVAAPKNSGQGSCQYTDRVQFWRTDFDKAGPLLIKEYSLIAVNSLSMWPGA
jgi:hypothetical protein